MVSAVTQDQWRLLDVQAHDTRLAQIAHREKTLPELAELAALNDRERLIADDLVRARTNVSDLQRELTKAELDVEQVRSRAARDQARLDSGQGSAKDMQALTHELTTLANRQSVLEDAELEVMERHEAATAVLKQAELEDAQLQGQIQDAQARRDRALADLADERAREISERADAVAGVPADLIAMYERIRSRGGVGAAKLHQRRCEGCRLELNAQDLGALRGAADDAVIVCEECGCILVRTADSGL